MGIYIRKPLTMAIISLSSILAANISLAETPGYNFVDAKYTHINLDSSAQLDGFVVDGSAELGENWFIFGSYSDTEDDRIPFRVIEAEQTQLGAGYYWNTSDVTNVFLSASYLDAEVSTRSASADGNGFAISTGIRSNISENFELNAALSYADVEDTDGVELGIGSVYSFGDIFALLAEATIDDDSNASGSVGIRIKF